MRPCVSNPGASERPERPADRLSDPSLALRESERVGNTSGLRIDAIFMLNACTIIACNYLPFARVLADSFFDSSSGGPFTVLLVDDEAGRVLAT